MQDKQLADKAINIKGKEYVQVKDRVIYFNETFPNGSIETELVSDNGKVVMKAKVTPDVKNPTRFYTGYSASNPGKLIEKQVPHEVAETSAVGRALAMMGIGVIDSFASVEEMDKVLKETKQAVEQKNWNPDDINPDNDVMERHMSEGQKCRNCGAEMVKSPKTGKWFCSEKCWLS